MSRVLFHLIGLGLLMVLTACATRFNAAPGQEAPSLQVQSRLLLTPTNGGQRIAPTVLRAGDLLLSSANSLTSVGIRVLSVTPVSHAALYLGDGQVVEAVGSGVRLRPVADFVAEEATIVAFRHPAMSDAQAQSLRQFSLAQVGKKYNSMGIVLQAPFTLQRQTCELPVVPGLVRDFCIRGLAAVQLGAARNDRFFCSQLVLQAYQQAQLPLTTADPLLVTPADLLHMREGDVPSMRTEQALQYVGHLKSSADGAGATEVALTAN
jgi:cell wall-associated NlpC family hydrolase